MFTHLPPYPSRFLAQKIYYGTGISDGTYASTCTCKYLPSATKRDTCINPNHYDCTFLGAHVMYDYMAVTVAWHAHTL